MTISPSPVSQLQRASWRKWPDSNESIIRASPTWQTPVSGPASASASTVARLCMMRLPKPISWPSPAGLKILARTHGGDCLHKRRPGEDQ